MFSILRFVFVPALRALLNFFVSWVIREEALRAVVQWLLRVNVVLISRQRSVGQGDGVAEVADIHTDVEPIPW